MADKPPSNWLDATVFSDETLRLILQLAYAYEELFGRKMTATELRASLRAPGK